MMNKRVLLGLCLIFIMFVSLGVVSAEDTNSTSLSIDSGSNSQDYVDESLAVSNQETVGAVTSDDIPTIDSGTVSGGVDVVATHPWGPTDSVNGNHGNLVYNIPSKATDIECAYVYVSIYSGSAQSNYGSVADISIKTDNGYLNKTENLWISSGTTDGVNYVVNDHITKCYSDYMIFYNITELVQGLKGTSIAINVDSLPMQGKSFDGRIKLISLILAYNDGDSDAIDYWINAGQAWTDETTYTNFNSGDSEIDSNTKVTLTNIGLSSNDAFYEINGESLFSEEGDEYISGDYYQYHKWDITDYFIGDTEIAFTSSKDGWASFKEVLSVLIINHNFSEDDESNKGTIVDFKTEYSTGTNSAICIFAGTNNTVTVKALTNNKGTYDIELLVDGVRVDKTKVNLLKNVAKTIVLTDSTIRDVDKNTAYGANNKKVNYTVRISQDGKVINSSSHLIPVLYNGYLGKDLAYPSEGYDLFFSETITGDIKIDIKDETTYLERTELKRTDVWKVSLPKNSNFVKAYVYVPYNYFIPDYSNKIPEDKNMFDVTFNDKKITPVGFYRDQSNVGNYAKYGYGLLVYDITDLIKTGDNTFILNKKDTYPAVSPATLIYMYNTTGSTDLKEIYILNGVDLLENSYNLANRSVKSDVSVNVDTNLVDDATLHVFAAGAQKGEGNIAFNGITKLNVWDGTLFTTDLYTLDVTKSIDKTNNVSFISTGSTIQALQQIIVLNKKLQTSVSNIATAEDVVFAGIKNNVDVTVANSRSGKCTVKLLADGKEISSSEVTLNGNSFSLTLTDSTIRVANKDAAYGANNKKVNYTVQIVLNNKVINSSSKEVSILYNGYLGKDLEYPSEGYELFFNGTITGDIVINTTGNYLQMSALERSDVWSVKLSYNSNFVKAYIYVPYYFFDNSLGIIEGKSMFSTMFNGVKITPAGFYRDQINYGKDAEKGYGLLVYDVSALIKEGKNTFTLNKNKPTPLAVCPSTLIYLYNSTGNSVCKNVYISNGADLLSSDAINGLSQVKSDLVINVDLKNVVDAKLYVFAAGAQKGEGNIVFNEISKSNVWNGKAFTSEVYSLNVKDNLKKSNTISFISTGNDILALQQILVASFKIDTSISASNANVDYGADLIVTLKDDGGNALSNKPVSIELNGKQYAKTTDGKGQAKLTVTLAPGTYPASLTFLGDDRYAKSTSSVNVVVKKATPAIAAAQKNFEPTVKTKKYSITLKANNKPMKSTKVTLKVNGRTYSATTNNNGVATFKLTKLTKKGTYKATVTYNGNKNYKKATKLVTITVKPTPKITAKKATFKVKTKTKQYAATLKVNNKAMKSTKVSLKVNGKTYSAKTNSKGKATFKITKLTKKGTYSATISFAGNKNYNKASKSVKITVK